jgi:hypothetical protein
VRGIIDDANYYDYLKLLAAWLRVAGYAGLLVCLDELVVVSHRLNNRSGTQQQLRGGSAHSQRLFAG